MAKTNDDMIARLPKERQEKINKAVAEEVAKYTKNESISSLNEKLEKFLEENKDVEIRQYIIKNRYYVELFVDGSFVKKKSFSSYEDKQKYIEAINKEYNL